MCVALIGKKSYFLSKKEEEQFGESQEKFDTKQKAY